MGCCFYLDDNPAKSKWLTQEEKGLLLQRLEEEEQIKKAQGESCHSFADAFSNAKVWLFCAGLLRHGDGQLRHLFLAAADHQGDHHHGPVAHRPDLGHPMVGSGGRHGAEWAITRTRPASGVGTWLWPAIIGALAFAVSAMPGVTGWGGIAALTVATAGVMSAVSCFWSLPTSILSGTAAAAGIAWINSVGNLAGYVSPMVVGKIRDATHSMTLALSVLSVSVLIAGLLTLYVTSIKSKQAATQPASQTS